MRNDEVTSVIAMIDASWPNSKPLPRETIAVWGSELVRHDFRAAMAVVQRLAIEQKFRPSLAEIVEPLRTAIYQRTSSDAFANVWEQIPKRPPVVTDLEAEAVRRLGGWDVLRSWKLNDRHWHAQRFTEIYRDLRIEAHREELRALAGAPVPALPEGKKT